MNDSSSQVNNRVKVMLVDDSAVVRGMMLRILKPEPDIEIVHTVANGQQAVDSIKQKKPDVLILDVEMPVMNGIEALPKLIEKCPHTKIIMCSTLTVRNAEITMKALQLGATESIAKPTNPTEISNNGTFRQDLLNLVRTLGGLGEAARSKGTATAKQSGKFTLHSDPHGYKNKPDIIAIGSSTGGPQALLKVLTSFKGFDIPVVLTQHMPPTFTTILARQISQHAGVEAIEGETNMKVEKGKIYIAPGGFHMRLQNRNNEIKIKLDESDPINFCKPSVEPMFESTVDIFGKKTMGLMLTGMGHDGLNGSKKLVEAGGRMIAQDEATSVVWGMPGAVAMANICHAVLPLDTIGPWIKREVMGA